METDRKSQLGEARLGELVARLCGAGDMDTATALYLRLKIAPTRG